MAGTMLPRKKATSLLFVLLAVFFLSGCIQTLGAAKDATGDALVGIAMATRAEFCDGSLPYATLERFLHGIGKTWGDWHDWCNHNITDTPKMRVLPDAS